MRDKGGARTLAGGWGKMWAGRGEGEKELGRRPRPGLAGGRGRGRGWREDPGREVL